MDSSHLRVVITPLKVTGKAPNVKLAITIFLTGFFSPTFRDLWTTPVQAIHSNSLAFPCLSEVCQHATNSPNVKVTITGIQSINTTVTGNSQILLTQPSLITKKYH